MPGVARPAGDMTQALTRCGGAHAVRRRHGRSYGPPHASQVAVDRAAAGLGISLGSAGRERPATVTTRSGSGHAQGVSVGRRGCGGAAPDFIRATGLPSGASGSSVRQPSLGALRRADRPHRLPRLSAAEVGQVREHGPPRRVHGTERHQPSLERRLSPSMRATTDIRRLGLLHLPPKSCASGSRSRAPPGVALGLRRTGPPGGRCRRPCSGRSGAGAVRRGRRGRPVRWPRRRGTRPGWCPGWCCGPRRDRR